jgi:hypothetical protein
MARKKKPRQRLHTLSDDAIAVLAEMRRALSAPLVLVPSPRTDVDASYIPECGTVYASPSRSAAISELCNWGLAAMCDGVGAAYAITRAGLEWDGHPYRWFDE